MIFDFKRGWREMKIERLEDDKERKVSENFNSKIDLMTHEQD